MEPTKPRPPAVPRAPTPPSDSVGAAIRAAVEEALSPTRAWRRDAEARLDRLELEIAALRKSKPAPGE